MMDCKIQIVKIMTAHFSLLHLFLQEIPYDYINKGNTACPNVAFNFTRIDKSICQFRCITKVKQTRRGDQQQEFHGNRVHVQVITSIEVNLPTLFLLLFILISVTSFKDNGKECQLLQASVAIVRAYLYGGKDCRKNTFVARLHMKILRQDNPGTRVYFVSIMADPRALVTGSIALMNYIITTYVELQGAFIVYVLNVGQQQDSFS